VTRNYITLFQSLEIESRGPTFGIEKYLFLCKDFDGRSNRESASSALGAGVQPQEADARTRTVCNELDSHLGGSAPRTGHHEGRLALFVEDPGGEVLAQIVARPWDLTVFLRVAIVLAVTLGRLHQQAHRMRFLNE